MKIQCPRCHNAMELPPAPETPQEVFCRACMSRQSYLTFPAFEREPIRGQVATPILVEGESACFFHPNKRAQVPCDLCGRFLCALCELEIGEKHFCSGCLTTAQQRGSLSQMERRRFVPESAALCFAALGLVLPLAIFTGPIAIFFTVRSFTTQGSIVGRKTFILVIAMLLVLIQFIVLLMAFVEWMKSR